MRNVAVRLVGRVSDRTAAYNASGAQDSGCELLLGKGDMIAFLGSRHVPFKAAIADLGAFAKQWPPRTGRVPATEPCVPLQVRSAPAPEAHGGGNGRGYDDIPAALVQWIQEQPEPPSARAVRRWAVENLGAEYRHQKAMDALALARGRPTDAPRQVAREAR